MDFRMDWTSRMSIVVGVRYVHVSKSPRYEPKPKCCLPSPLSKSGASPQQVRKVSHVFAPHHLRDGEMSDPKEICRLVISDHVHVWMMRRR